MSPGEMLSVMQTVHLGLAFDLRKGLRSQVYYFIIVGM